MEQKQPTPAPKAEVPKDFRHLVRITNTDLLGEKPIGHALHKIKGIGFMYANAVCTVARIDARKQTGLLTDAEIAKLEEVISNPLKYSIPVWMLNRRKDYEDGTDKHLLTADFDYSRDNDIKRLKKIRAYRGIRHMLGQPTRGQKTKSNFRKNNGKVMGVKRAKVAPGAAPDKGDKGKK